MSPVKIFHKYRGLNNLTLGALLAAAGDLLPRMVGPQNRYLVRDLPSERTVRYYLSLGVIDRPQARKGTASLYGYRHLLQILAVKTLQRQHLPLQTIATVIEGRSNRELEQLLPQGRAAGGSFPAAALTGRRDYRKESPSGKIRRGEGRRSGMGGDLFWRRLQLAPGIELHLREDVRCPPRDRSRRRWKVELLENLIGLLSPARRKPPPSGEGGEPAP